MVIHDRAWPDSNLIIGDRNGHVVVPGDFQGAVQPDPLELAPVELVEGVEGGEDVDGVAADEDEAILPLDDGGAVEVVGKGRTGAPPVDPAQVSQKSSVGPLCSHNTLFFLKKKSLPRCRGSPISPIRRRRPARPPSCS